MRKAAGESHTGPGRDEIAGEEEGAPMDADRWERIQALFHAAYDLPDDRRGPYLERACGGDEELRCHVSSLLAADEGAEELLLRAVREVARSLVRSRADEEATGDL